MEKNQWNKNQEHQNSIEEIVRITSNHIENYPKDNVYFCLMYDYLNENNEEKVGVLSTKNTNQNYSFSPVSLLIAEIIKTNGEEYLMETIKLAKKFLLDEPLEQI